ncbi:MAG: pilus assembly protein CpaB, partial [Actinomycetota bacterium]|nr:pilus assembly protein CpaB [Actinomycetota bacterium]
MGRRVALLISAIVIAAIGTTLVYLYAKNANDRAIADQSPVTVLVAAENISAGTTADQAVAAGSMVLKKVASNDQATGVVGNPAALQGQVALGTIFQGQQIVSAMFGSAANAGTTDLQIPKGLIAASFSFQDPNRVAGFLQAGSKVAVWVTTAAGNTSGDTTTRLLLARVQILAVGATTISPAVDPTKANPEAPPRALMTLALTQREAEKLVHAQTLGDLYLGLLSDSSKVSTTDKGVTA